MNTTAAAINLLALICLTASFFKDREKTVKSLKVAAKSFLNILPMVFIVIILIGLLIGFVPPEKIFGILGEKTGIMGLINAAVIGSIIHIPAIIAFPLTASLLQEGASLIAAAGFITTLTMIGTVTLPLEIKELGAKFALLRNILSFVAAVLIAILMGIIL